MYSYTPPQHIHKPMHMHMRIYTCAYMHTRIPVQICMHIILLSLEVAIYIKQRVIQQQLAMKDTKQVNWEYKGINY